MKFNYRQQNGISTPLMSRFFFDSTKIGCQKRKFNNRKRFRYSRRRLKFELLFLILKKA